MIDTPLPRIVLLALAVSGAVACAPDADPAPGDGARSPDAAAAAAAPGDSAAWYASRVMESLGGRGAWDRTRYLEFHWIVTRDGEKVADRHHRWDRYDGRYRLEYESDGREILVLFNEKELTPHPELGKVPAGRAWRGGTEVTGAARDSLLAGAYRAFINDSYWLLMPFKWNDPGVHLAYEGTRELSDGREYAVVHLTFDEGLGVTEDQYWGFVDPASGRMLAWRYHLGRNEEPGPVIWWEDWTSVGPVEMAMSRRSEAEGASIGFEGVVASDTVPPGVFEPPSS